MFRRPSKAATTGAAIVLAAAALGSLTSCSKGRDEPTAPLPNLLLISIDTLRADHTSIHGYVRDTTPNLARLASGGAVFETAYAPVPSTAPTHASLFTGTRPSTHGLRKNGRPLAEGSLTLAEMLATRGYQTAGVASSFVLDGRFGFGQGFDTWLDDFDPEHASVSVDEWMGFPVPRGFDSRADATTRRALRWLWVERDPDRPFFLFVHYFDPHAPYEPPAGFDAKLPAVPGPDSDPQPGPLSQLQRDRYDAEIAFVDQEVDRLLRGIEALDLPGAVLTVVTADHGEGLMDHGIWRHGLEVYEEAVRVPLVFRWDGEIQAGLRIPGPVELVDVVPTVLDLLGIEEHGASFDGRSLAGALREGEPLPADRAVLLYRSHYEPGIVEGIPVAGELFAIRQGRWKLIEHTAGPEPELYDLATDPGETRNLRDATPDEVERLSAAVAKWRSGGAADDPAPAISGETRRALEALGYAE